MLIPVLALHPEDVVAVAGVILVWVALRRLARRGRHTRHDPPGPPSRLGDDG